MKHSEKDKLANRSSKNRCNQKMNDFQNIVHQNDNQLELLDNSNQANQMYNHNHSVEKRGEST